ncbi:hypothetical protein CHUAL_012831 [Chamberlinius hualienensis]
MICVKGRTAFLLLVILLVWTTTSQWQCDAAIDCRRFVFAPICRGVSAKRADMSLREDNLPKQILGYRKNLWLRTPNEQQPPFRDATQEDAVKLLRRYLSRKDVGNASA